ncbi:MAG: SH3 domain-containing protein [Thermodesulfobacteriota bacterium]
MRTSASRPSFPLCLALALSLLLLPAAATDALAEMVSIAAARVNLRSGPGTHHPVEWILGRGYPLLVLQKKGRWLKVRDYAGDTGWVYAKLTGRAPHLVVKKKEVNIRSGPSTGYRVVARAKKGVVFRTLSHSRGWVKVRHQSGTAGWIKRTLLWGW